MAELSQILVGATNFTNTDTKNTAGSTDTSSKIFLIGATSQAANPQTYSQDTAYVGIDGCLYSGGSKVLTAHQSVTNKDATLAWSTKSTVATIGSTDITVSLPANPNTDTKVTQTDWADNVNHRVLFSYSDAAGDVTNKVYKSSGFVYNPYNKKLNIGSLNATSSFISLTADSTDGANVQFSNASGESVFTFDSSTGDGILTLGDISNNRAGNLILADNSGNRCIIAPTTLSGSRVTMLPDASGTVNVLTGECADTDNVRWKVLLGSTDGETKIHSRLMYRPRGGQLYAINSSGAASWSLSENDITSTSAGYSQLILGNGVTTESGARYGLIQLYKKGYWAKITPSSTLTANRYAYLPDAEGDILVASATTDTDTTDQEIYFGKGGVAKYHSNRLIYRPSQGMIKCFNSSNEQSWKIFDNDIDDTGLGTALLDLGTAKNSGNGRRKGNIRMYDGYGSMVTIDTPQMSGNHIYSLPNAAGTIALDNQIFFVREIPVSITFNGETVKAQEKDCTLSGYNILGVIGYYQGSNLAFYPEYFDVNYGNSHVTIKLRRYNNSAYTGTVTGNMKLLYTKLSIGSLANG